MPAAPQVPPSTTMSTKQAYLNTASNVVNPLVGNPALYSAMEVLSNLSDVGKTIPLIAPVFILLKIIIDIERKVEDVDAKCTDLLERITFMLSHLPMLKDIDIMPATRQVIERMTGVLKEAAALISAYRKQSFLARRLSISNRERFTFSVEAVNSCCQNLLMSLQIHQSKQLEILTRAVPLDEYDQAAVKFVDEHGGDFEAVKYDRELVKEFAVQQHLDIPDEAVMEQLGENVADVVKEVEGRIETVIKENIGQNVGTAIVDGLKSFAALLNATENEQRLGCVQCEQKFTRSTNGPKACSFHRAELNSGVPKTYPCCDMKLPCQYGYHREKHHCDYPYGPFFARFEMLQSKDIVDKWASIQDTDLEVGRKVKSEVQKASVGQLLRWVTGGARLEEPTILISVGQVTFQSKYYFQTFTVPELENIAKSVRYSRRTLIFRNSPNDDQYSMAEWLLAVSGKITGVRITAKAVTSSTPFVRVVPIDLSTGQKSGEILAISEGGLRSYIPASPYILPETVRVGPEISDKPIRDTRTDFKSCSSPSLRVILRNMADPPLDKVSRDSFRGSICVFNDNAAGSSNQVIIARAKASYRFIGDSEYQRVSAVWLDERALLPVTINARQLFTFTFGVTVPRTEEEQKTGVLCALHRPLRLKIILEDIEGEECSLVLEYVHKPWRFDEPYASDIAILWMAEPIVQMERRTIRVSKARNTDTLLDIDNTDVTVMQLQRVVYHAIKTGKTEIHFSRKEFNSGEWQWTAWALVDISCQRVYAFKILLEEGKLKERKQFACLGYVLCPEYGDVIQETRPISYATESITIPPLEPYTLPAYPTDDTLDDFKPPPRALNGSSGASLLADTTKHQAELPHRLTEPLDNTLERIAMALEQSSLDNNIARIAVALEQLVGMLGQLQAESRRWQR
ncbi:hypothetical protein FA15DRAFT_694323 [Coprinopsis marcescibilis]|uniref:Mixed lineage kinase domain-containing protein n=1 Tax=Coprinopsis marcescibilis TaxID=230819 RepID=A0A5C3KXT7_COPMA|nr:hypothetical protein FA15DRAFT_694323 [Coprinopsis marcescibilis]